MQDNAGPASSLRTLLPGIQKEKLLILRVAVAGRTGGEGAEALDKINKSHRINRQMGRCSQQEYERKRGDSCEIYSDQRYYQRREDSDRSAIALGQLRD